MAITLEAISLPDLVISDEFAWSGVYSEVDRALSGGVIIWEKEIYGTPIDLVCGSDTAWIERSVLLELKTLVEVPNATYTLDYEGVVKTVRFRHEEGSVIIATPIVGRPNHEDSDLYSNVVIKLMEV